MIYDFALYSSNLILTGVINTIALRSQPILLVVVGIARYPRDGADHLEMIVDIGLVIRLWCGSVIRLVVVCVVGRHLEVKLR